MTMLGKTQSPETRAKIAAAIQGIRRSPETRAKISKSKTGARMSDEARAAIAAGHRGLRLSAETRAKLSEQKRGDRNPAWKGGVNPEHKRIRRSPEYATWRATVFARDDYTCQSCGAAGVTLNADHILPFATHEDLRFDIKNGRTLCVPCHRATPTYGTRTG